MARIVLISPYLKGGQNAAKLMHRTPLHLTPREFDLLEVLLRNRGIVLYREVLYERVWGLDAEYDSRTLDLHIQRLRKKLGWKNEIRTVFRVGYVLERGE